MYESKTHQVQDPDREHSSAVGEAYRPWQTTADVEFVTKVSISVVDGYPELSV